MSWGIAESDEDHEYVRTNIMYFMASMLDLQFVSIWVDVGVNNKEITPSSQRTFRGELKNGVKGYNMLLSAYSFHSELFLTLLLCLFCVFPDTLILEVGKMIEGAGDASLRGHQCQSIN